MPIEKQPLTVAQEAFRGLKVTYEFIKQTGNEDLIKIAEDELKSVAQGMRAAVEKLMKAHKGENEEETPSSEEQRSEIYEPPTYEQPVLDKFRAITGCSSPVSPHDQLFLVLVHEMLTEGKSLSETEIVKRARLKRRPDYAYKICEMVQNREKYEVVVSHEAQLISDLPSEETDARAVLKRITGINAEPEPDCDWQLLLWQLAKVPASTNRSLPLKELRSGFGTMTTAKRHVTSARKKFGSPYRLEENTLYKLCEKSDNQ